MWIGGESFLTRVYMNNPNFKSLVARSCQLFVFSALCVLATGTQLTAKDLQVWVCIGQSLMNGPVGNIEILTSSEHDTDIIEYVRGATNSGFQSIADVRLQRARISPAEVFSREIWDYGEGDIVIIRISPGGHSITAFLDEERRLVPKKSDNVNLWPYWIDFTEEKIDWLRAQGNTVTLRGVMMFQGSSDRNSTYSTYYEEHLRRLVADARSELGENLRWLQVVSPTWNTGEHVLRVQTAQRTVANSVEDMEYVESDNPLGTPIVFTDGTHPDLASTERIGVVMARAWVNCFPTYRNFMFGSGYGDSLSNPEHDVDGDGASLLEYAMGGDMTRYDLVEWVPELIHENEETFLDVVVRDNDADSIHLDAEFTVSLDSPLWDAGLEAIHSSQVGVPTGFVRKRYTSPLNSEGLKSQFARVSVESIFDPVIPDATVPLTSNMVVR